MNVLIPLLFIVILVSGRYRIKSCVNSNDDRRVRRYISYALLLFIAMSRYCVGHDYKQYLAIYNVNTHVVNIFNGRLLGTQNFGIFSKIVYDIAILLNSSEFIFIVYAVLTLGFVFKAIENEATDKFEALMIFFTLFYLNTFSTLRQSLANAIIIWAIKYVKKKNIWGFLLSIICASFVHSSAVFAIPIYFVFNYIGFCGICAIVLIVCFLGRPIIERVLQIGFLNHYQQYYYGLIKNNGGTKIIYFFLIIIFACIIMSCLIKSESDEHRKYLSVVCAGIIFPIILGDRKSVV